MFAECNAFNQPLNNWDVSNVRNMNSMFMDCTTFNYPLNGWTVSKVRDMNGMFMNCYAFNRPLNGWDVSRVTDMSSMFMDCVVFNGALDTWNISSVEDMSNMFNGCEIYNQNLNTWDVSDIETEDMFENCGIDAVNMPQMQPIQLPPVVGVQLPIGPQVVILNEQDINDIVMGAPVKAHELPTYLTADPTDNYIMFQQHNNFFITYAHSVEVELDSNAISNSLVLICVQEWESRLDITPDCLRDETIYINLSKLGLVHGGYVRASEMKSVIEDSVANTGPPHIYVLTVDNATPPAPSVVSWSLYKKITMGLVNKIGEANVRSSPLPKISPW
jgi:surface protein